MKELVNSFDTTGKDWSKESTENLINYGVRLRDFIFHFNFATVDGLDNLTSNLHVILREITMELRNRNIRL